MPDPELKLIRDAFVLAGIIGPGEEVSPADIADARIHIAYLRTPEALARQLAPLTDPTIASLTKRVAALEARLLPRCTEFIFWGLSNIVTPSLEFCSTDKAWVELKTVPYGFLEGREHYSVETFTREPAQDEADLQAYTDGVLG